MRDFYAGTSPVPLDQADGLRRLFAARRGHLIALAANPHVAFGGVVLDRLAQALAAGGREVLVVDAGAGAPAPHELSRLDLAAGIERVARRVSYLPARGLPMAHVDTRGSAAGFLDALHDAAPEADVLLVHADAAELARMLTRRAARPLLLGADHPESVKHAYASAKLLARRTGLATFDLLLVAAAQSPRIARIAASLAGCLDGFLQALLCRWAHLDPADDTACEHTALAALLDAQLALGGTAPAPVAGTAVPPAGRAGVADRTRVAWQPACPERARHVGTRTVTRTAAAPLHP
ncbi:MAG TPA: flagellar biosynthesis protein [Rubrivivax sp.]|nr:flagellar biosynthesis protein [Rubrivivax sp.]